MNERELINYYNKFNEDKRLSRRHGIVEFETAIKYINMYLSNFKDAKILDVGAGTGRYSMYFSNLGYDVTAVELVKHNLRVLEKNCPSVKSYLGNAIDLSSFKSNSFEIYFEEDDFVEDFADAGLAAVSFADDDFAAVCFSDTGFFSGVFLALDTFFAVSSVFSTEAASGILICSLIPAESTVTCTLAFSLLFLTSSISLSFARSLLPEGVLFL